MDNEEILNLIDIYFNLTNNFSETQFIYGMEEMTANTKLPFYWASGASKGVFWIPDWKIVIKIPFTVVADGEYSNSYNSIDDNDDDDEDDDSYWMSGACRSKGTMDDSNVHWDYCRAETNAYQYAIDNGYGEFFAETKRIGYVQGHPIYSQEKVKICSGEGDDYNISEKDSLDLRSKLDNDYINHTSCKTWDFSLYQYLNYDYDKFKDIMNFVYQDAELSDFHSHNLGYLDNRPVFVDYSGFND